MQKIYKIMCLVILGIIVAPMVLAYQQPTVSAGPDIYVTSGRWQSNPSAILQGTASDSNNGTLAFNWSCTGGTLSNNNVVAPLFTAPSNIWWSETYVCTLTATNNYGLSASDSAIVYINGDSVNPANNVSIQTNGATDISSAQAVLSGTISGSNYGHGTINGWFQWGTSTSYGSESAHKPVSYVGVYDQHIAELLPNTTYHFRAVIQGDFGTLYGQDVTFVSAPYGFVNAGQVLGASTISTGLTNNFLTDSFFLPLLIIIAGLWFYISGNAYELADWLKAKKY